jgi:hypothetical protein
MVDRSSRGGVGDMEKKKKKKKKKREREERRCKCAAGIRRKRDPNAFYSRKIWEEKN